MQPAVNRWFSQFSIGQRVLLRTGDYSVLKCGVVNAVMCEEGCVSYRVTYWTDGRRHSEWIAECELLSEEQSEQ
jgi:hypothetical protein